MEAEGAKVLWSRSIELHKLRYRWMVSGGDSKAHSAVEDTYTDCKVESGLCWSCPKTDGKTLDEFEGNH
jgi:hypothetical protein